MTRRTLEFGGGIIVVGLLTGVAGMSTALLLRAVEHPTYHYSFGTLLSGVTGSSPLRRALGPMIGGALAGLGWWLRWLLVGDRRRGDGETGGVIC